MTPNLVLVASYPKSGNTWLRLVFENLRRDQGQPVGLNSMSNGFYGPTRRLLFDSISLANAADLLPNEIDSLLPFVFHRFNAEAAGPVIMKVHDCAFRNRDGNWLFPPECVRRVIYLVRHPFDVAVSSAHHFGYSFERSVDVMATNLLASASTRRLPLSLQEHVGSWSSHVRSWTTNVPYLVTFARYEDIFASPPDAFAYLAAAAGIPCARADLERAVEATRFDRLQSEEIAEGFSERPAASAAFFRVGRPRNWEGELTEELRARLCRDHGEVMRAFGYEEDGSTIPLSPELQMRSPSP